jgi:hypothetical protein
MSLRRNTLHGWRPWHRRPPAPRSKEALPTTVFAAMGAVRTPSRSAALCRALQRSGCLTPDNTLHPTSDITQALRTLKLRGAALGPDAQAIVQDIFMKWPSETRRQAMLSRKVEEETANAATAQLLAEQAAAEYGYASSAYQQADEFLQQRLTAVHNLQVEQRRPPSARPGPPASSRAPQFASMVAALSAPSPAPPSPPRRPY